MGLREGIPEKVITDIKAMRERREKLEKHIIILKNLRARRKWEKVQWLQFQRIGIKKI